MSRYILDESHEYFEDTLGQGQRDTYVNNPIEKRLFTAEPWTGLIELPPLQR